MPGEPMEAAQRSAEYVFQGIMYYFRREKVCPRYQFTLKDPVDPALLQQALDAALEAAPYYRVRLVWEKRKAFLEPNSEPCLVYPDSVMREMPEQTNGYFFAVHCAQNTVYFDWFHFIADGHGVSPFLTRILELYCNLRYGTAFANPPIPCLSLIHIYGALAETVAAGNEKGRHQGLTIDEREKRRERQPAGDLHGVEFGGVGQHDGDHAHALEHVEHADGVDGAGSGAFHEKGPSLRRPETCDQQAHTVKNDPFIRI